MDRRLLNFLIADLSRSAGPPPPPPPGPITLNVVTVDNFALQGGSGGGPARIDDTAFADFTGGPHAIPWSFASAFYMALGVDLGAAYPISSVVFNQSSNQGDVWDKWRIRGGNDPAQIGTQLLTSTSGAAGDNGGAVADQTPYRYITMGNIPSPGKWTVLNSITIVYIG